VNVGRVTHAPDYQSDQPTLFPNADPARCPVPGCGAIRLTNPPLLTCRHDLNPPDDRPYKRPRGCLNRPQTTDIPY